MNLIIYIINLLFVEGGKRYIFNLSMFHKRIAAIATVLLLGAVCVAGTIWTNQWAVHVPNGKGAADRVALEHGFENLGEVCFKLKNWGAGMKFFSLSFPIMSCPRLLLFFFCL